MEAIKDMSINIDATIQKGEENVPAKDVLCAFLPAALEALEAAKALVKNPFLKLIIGIVANALESLGENFCGEE